MCHHQFQQQRSSGGSRWISHLIWVTSDRLMTGIDVEVHWMGWAFLVLSKGFRNPRGTRVRVWRVGVRVWNVWPHKPPPLSEGKGIPHCYPWVSPVMFVGNCHITNVLIQQTSLSLLNNHHRHDHPHCITTIAHHHHLWQPLFNQPPPPLHTPMMTTMWQHLITGPMHTLFWPTLSRWWQVPTLNIEQPWISLHVASLHIASLHVTSLHITSLVLPQLWLLAGSSHSWAKIEAKLSRADGPGSAATWAGWSRDQAGILSIINHSRLAHSKQIKLALFCTCYSVI